MKKLSTYHKILVGIVLSLTVLFVVILMNNNEKIEQLPESKELYEVSDDKGATSVEISPEELSKIRLWIKDNNLDDYGNPEGTIYAGGNPLFDEKTEETMLIYDYLLKNNPDKPWQKYNADVNKDESINQDSKEDKGDITKDEKKMEEEKELSFSEIKEWSNLSKPSYDLEYPKFAKVEDKDDIVKLSGEDNFLMYIYRDTTKVNTALNLKCEKLDLIDTDNASICYNDSVKYNQIYQRVKDSVIAK